LLARASRAAAVVTVSNANARHLETTFGIPRARIHVIPSGVDVEQFRPASADAVATSRWMVCVARHVRVKNLDLLLRACALLRDRGVQFQCAMVGGGVLRAELQATRDSLNLDRLVEMTGEATEREVLSWWQRAAVGVLTSDSEGMPVSLMEAAACGVPVVATSVGGVPELVDDGTTGYLVPRGDAEGLADKLGRLLENSDVRSTMGADARRRAQQRFALTRQVDQLLALWSADRGV
jgi:glycosyltransferase involved in cell wall biosynthesis